MEEKRITQKQRLKGLFLKNPNEWISLKTILSLYISQFGARIFELRGEGMKIENKTELADGQKHSWYKYVKYESAKYQATMPFARRDNG